MTAAVGNRLFSYDDYLMPSEYKLFVKHPTGDLSSLSIPSFLIENRVELWKAAFQDATARIRDEYNNTANAPLPPNVAIEIKEKHKKYFNEYFELEGRAYKIVTETERAWLGSLGTKKLMELGQGDRSDGIDHILLRICQIADDEVQPILESQNLL